MIMPLPYSPINKHSQISHLTCIKDGLGEDHLFRLSDTNFFCEISFDVVVVWFKHSDEFNKGMEFPERCCSRVNFETVLDEAPKNVKDELLFHLDLFV